MLNLNLPARVWVPIHPAVSDGDSTDSAVDLVDHSVHHQVVRVPPQAATVLNSKDKAPYIIYVECIDVADVSTSPLVPKSLGGTTSTSVASGVGGQNLGQGQNQLRHVKSEERLNDNNSSSSASSPGNDLEAVIGMFFYLNTISR